MARANRDTLIGVIMILFLLCSIPQTVSACSTFRLQKGPELICGHNLNQGDIGVPGMVFINKRGVFKLGRTWDELITKERMNPSSHRWISRYGSVTFNAFGKNLPDGGINEVGLYIWEMNEDAEYPQDTGLPKLNQMSWMQYILDNYSTVDEAVQCASETEIDGWGWHFFVGDAEGRCAAIAFIDGEVVVNRDETMPVPGLFNTPYDRELELLRYYRGFGGLYQPVLHDLRVPRFVKTAVMVRDYDPAQDVVDYGFAMLDTLKVYDVPEWSILCDLRRRVVYFKTRVNPHIKSLQLDDIDFSNEGPVLVLNIDTQKGGDILGRLHPYSNEEMRTFTRDLVVPLLPEEFFTHGGLSLEEYVERTTTHNDDASSVDTQPFVGVWKSTPDGGENDMPMTLRLETRADAVFGDISLSEGGEEPYRLDHIHLTGHELSFTFEVDGSRDKFLEAKGDLDGDVMRISLNGIEVSFGDFLLLREG
jgi:choloylglycine hydrolase